MSDGLLLGQPAPLTVTVVPLNVIKCRRSSNQSGEVRSAIAMTEPAPGAGADPGMLRTTAEEAPGGWVINGAKHLTTGADGAAFVICVARTDDGPTMFLVDADNPGLRVLRRMPSLDHISAPGGHCEVEFSGCFVPDSAVLGEVGLGMEYAQVRLAPSRLSFCMSWLGLATRAQELAARHISRREAFGTRIAEHGLAQGHLADNEIDIEASRALIARCAEVIDAEGPASSAARHEASVTKTFVSEAVWRVLDRAVQLHGGLGVCEDHLVARFLVEDRAFRIYEGPSEVLRWYRPPRPTPLPLTRRTRMATAELGGFADAFAGAGGDTPDYAKIREIADALMPFGDHAGVAITEVGPDRAVAEVAGAGPPAEPPGHRARRGVVPDRGHCWSIGIRRRHRASSVRCGVPGAA
ncbi:acyl-CoA dehydrogenase family protein [Amycolatopsis thermoflava]